MQHGLYVINVVSCVRIPHPNVTQNTRELTRDAADVNYPRPGIIPL
jgi:hypothetical protein